jgi:hypothetical protein
MPVRFLWPRLRTSTSVMFYGQSMSIPRFKGIEIDSSSYLFIYSFIFGSTGFELRAFHLLGRCPNS